MKKGEFGIYLNIKDLKILRINSPYWIPSGPDWVIVTTDVNSTLVKVRELVKEKGLVREPDKIIWDSLPHINS